jgi:hypothetical protein
MVFGMIPADETEMTAIAGGIVFVTLGVVRLVLQFRAARAGL